MRRHACLLAAVRRLRSTHATTVLHSAQLQTPISLTSSLLIGTSYRLQSTTAGTTSSSSVNSSSSNPQSSVSASASAAAASVLLHNQQRQKPQPGPQQSQLRGSTASTNTARSYRSSSHFSDDASLNTAEEVEEVFRCSVEARTVSNAQLRKYVKQLQGKDHALGVAAVRGAKAGGLKVTPPVYEVLLDLLIQGGQLLASMELYQQMLHKEHMTPTPRTYALLMELCLQREMPDACQRLFRDMQRRGMQPSPQNYDLMLSSLAIENPPKWEEAIAIFDKLTRERKSSVNAKTYNALMRVYMNMQPFDWRVVYNCYHEMCSRTPRIPLEWESYLLLREALRRGRAGRLRRFLAFLDAWMQATPLWSLGFLKGVLVYLAVMWVIKSVIGYFFLWSMEATSSGGGGGAGGVSDSILPTN